jgi:CDP-diacylglycerol--glycerol-3-phosphate 3-phosphatidyltransferase/CDP-diacylglycerol--inositol 3-phosphatidyltransferase
MFTHFRAFWTKVIADPIARVLLKLGVSPDAVPLVGTLGVSAAALWFFPRGQLLVGVLVITAFVFSDLVDGHMARLTGRTSPFGAFLDSTLDRIGDAAVFSGLVLYFAGPGDSMLYTVLSLVCLVMGSVTSYARSKGEQLGFNAKTGLAERPDRLVGLLIPTFFGDLFGLPILYEVGLWLIAALSTITVVQRILLVRRQALAPPNTESAPQPPQP